MNSKALLTGCFVLAGLLGTASPAFAQQSPPDSAEAKQIVALVDKAAALVDGKGKAAFAEFRKSGGEWRIGDTYLFLGDMKGVSLFNAGFPKMEGTDQSGLKDANGKLISMELVKAAQSNGADWVGYMWPKPGQSQPSHKWSYVKAVKVDGVPAYIGLLPAGAGGDPFIPVDETVSGVRRGADRGREVHPEPGHDPPPRQQHRLDQRRQHPPVDDACRRGHPLPQGRQRAERPRHGRRL